MNKRGQAMSGGLITGLVFGIASLVIAIIIALVITSTLGDANLLTAGRPSVSAVNETNLWLNQTGYTLAGGSVDYFAPGSMAISIVYNETNGTAGYPLILTSGNYTVSSAGRLVNASAVTYANVSVTYTYNTYSQEEISEIGLSSNFTDGINNVSDKVPTALLVAAIVLILGILGVLVEVWRRMQLGGSL